MYQGQVKLSNPACNQAVERDLGRLAHFGAPANPFHSLPEEQDCMMTIEKNEKKTKRSNCGFC